MSFSLSALQNALRSEALARSIFSSQSAKAVLRFGSYIGSNIDHRESSERLMNHAREQIASYENKGVSYPSGYVYSADQLLSGKGRFLRSWHAPKGGVWLTLVLANTLLPESSLLLPLAAGVACCETVQYFGIGASIKWVNDVHVQGKKIAGVLAETFSGPRYGEEYILLGIGLNVNNQDFPAELQATAGSMSMYGQGPFDLDAVRVQLLVKLVWNIGLLHYQEDNWLRLSDSGQELDADHPLIAAWRSLSDTPGKDVHFGFNVVDRVQYSARVVDIDNRGRLIMKLSDGTIVTENSGEIVYARR